MVERMQSTSKKSLLKGLDEARVKFLEIRHHRPSSYTLLILEGDEIVRAGEVWMHENTGYIYQSRYKLSSDWISYLMKCLKANEHKVLGFPAFRFDQADLLIPRNSRISIDS
jgi:hypothetical protein